MFTLLRRNPLHNWLWVITYALVFLMLYWLFKTPKQFDLVVFLYGCLSFGFVTSLIIAVDYQLHYKMGEVYEED